MSLASCRFERFAFYVCVCVCVEAATFTLTPLSIGLFLLALNEAARPYKRASFVKCTRVFVCPFCAAVLRVRLRSEAELRVIALIADSSLRKRKTSMASSELERESGKENEEQVD